ncbi:MAG TPA: hypothetical protein PK544_08515 [Spirochaetota bacterium]|nr:hypothetical protein [Spirochaetota bacterium]HPJ39334.1 hypothetical protein [Spirochaetota bacterium]HPQ53161.1 hypothetical protein [Spirochaetota bacterium]
MRKMVCIVIPFICFACLKNNIEDNYRAFEGTAIIQEIKDSQYNPDGKNQYSDIFINFIPRDSDAPAQYVYKSWKDTNVRVSHNSRMNHYKPWISKMNIKAGNKYEAIRYEKKSGFGSAPPVVFKVFFDRRK